MTEKVKKADAFFQTETIEFVVKGADDSIFANFDYDELVAITFALKERAKSCAENGLPKYSKYLLAIADKLEDFA